MGLKKDKDPKLYYSIKEVAQLFNLNESTLRFWEKEFVEISPKKTEKGTRFYSKEDIEKIRLVYHLLRERGLTLVGARQKLKDNKELTVNHEEISNRLKQIRSELVSLVDVMKDLGNNIK